MKKHWGRYAPNTSLDPYRKCLVCGRWLPNWWYKPKPLFHNGGRPRRRR